MRKEKSKLSKTNLKQSELKAYFRSLSIARYCEYLDIDAWTFSHRDKVPTKYKFKTIEFIENHWEDKWDIIDKLQW